MEQKPTAEEAYIELIKLEAELDKLGDFEDINYYFIENITDQSPEFQSILTTAWDLMRDYINDKEFVVKTIRMFPWLFKEIPEQFKADHEIALDATVLMNIDLFPKELLNNADFLNAWYLSNFYTFPSEKLDELTFEKEKLIKKLKKFYIMAKKIPQRLSVDRDFWLQAVQQEGLCLHFLNPEFWQDREIAIEAVKNHGLALKYCHSSFQSDPEIVKIAISQNPSNVRYANPEIFDVDEFLKSKKYLLEEYGNIYGEFNFKG